MNKYKLSEVLIIIVLFSSTKSIGQAWTKQKGASFTQIGYSSIIGNAKYSDTGDFLDLSREVSDLTLQFYHEMGITDRLTVIANVPVKFVSTGKEIVSTGFSGNILPSGNLNGLGNINLSAVYGIKQKSSLVYSVQLGAMLNTASEKQSVGLRTGVKAWGLAPSFHVGYGHDKFWSSFDLGGTLRSNDFSTQLFSTFQIGTRVKNYLHVIGQFTILQSMEDGKAADGNAIETGLYTNDVGYTAISLKLGYQLKSNLCVWGAFGGGFNGNDVLGAPAFSIALSYTRNKKK